MKQKSSLSIFLIIGISIVGGITGAALFSQSASQDSEKNLSDTIQSVNVIERVQGIASSTDFSLAAEEAIHSVVHVKTSVEQGYYYNPFKDFFFGFGESQPQATPRMVQSSGSGVIISEDGYIVTNNHVVENAKEVRVSLNDNREYSAEIIGVDPTTDLAVLKIDANKLSVLSFGNSDKVKLGEWVLAVGNPFNLTSTVTAGIISAKGRNINIIDDKSAIEAFIQTDAAVNPGNSGGALINTTGQLIGINTAISTRSGSYEGYSFAVPANIVRKVVDDMLKYGTVQRAYLGVNIVDVNQALAKDKSLKANQGVFISEVTENGAAKEAGIENGDVIIEAGGNEIKKSSELLEVIGSRRPGDNLKVTILRGSKKLKFDIILRNRDGNTDMLKKEEIASRLSLGGTFETLSDAQKNKYGLSSGVIITEIGDGKLKKAGIPAGFILTRLNNKTVNSQKDVEGILKKLNSGDGVLMQGYRSNGRPDYFAFGL
ncbi:MAG: Periplasmic pH-dependent serine endoprotease DegQ [Owenweeksia sp. TMED14]|nr:MAG: Periplasmic pH-dependent serine endoprotease DegQ [Owenweeksia sp. TMED14]|tara:strand:- start:948 stop:2408 length:1461 start_codon:yes stop_codon:yes gene_type:complete